MCLLFPVSPEASVYLQIHAVAQAIGAEGVVAAQCRSLVKAYLPQLIKIIATMPPDQVSPLISGLSQTVDPFINLLDVTYTGRNCENEASCCGYAALHCTTAAPLHCCGSNRIMFSLMT